MTTTSTNIEVRELDIKTAEGSPDVLYVAEEFPRKNMGTGRDYAAIVVRVGVDGYFDKVQASLDGAGDLEVVDRAIAALTTVRHDLAALDETRRRQRFSLPRDGRLRPVYEKRRHTRGTPRSPRK